MALNIKNERVCTLAREAAELTGATQTSAIEAALTAYLEQLTVADEQARQARGAAERLARVEALLERNRQILASLPPCDFSTDDLYDENGLPA